MNFELLTVVIAIIGMGIALGRMISNSEKRLRTEFTEGQNSLRAEIANSEQRLEAKIAGLRDDVAALSGRMDQIEQRMGRLEQRMARIEGLFEGFTARDRQGAA